MSIPDDAIRNALIGISAGVPVVGGPISFILDKYIPSEVERKRNKLLNQLNKDVEDLKDKIYVRNMYTPIFQSVFNSLLQASFTEYRHEKITAFRNIILQMLQTSDEIFLDQASFFSRLVILMIPDEIRILNIFYMLDIKRIYSDLDEGKNRNIYKIISKLCCEYDQEYISALIVDLQRYALISGSRKQKKLYNRGGIFLTTLGEKFTDYIFNPIEGKKEDD